MDNTIYIAMSREIATFRDLDVTANNIANANTVGFNGEQIIQNSFSLNVSPTHKMSMDSTPRTFRRTEEGPISITGNTFDVAITGPGFFTVDTPLGVRYTRAGNFQLDTDGNLITPNGYKVLDTSGQTVSFDPQDKKIIIGSAGNISANGEEKAVLGVVTFDNPQAVEPLGNNLFSSSAPPIQNPNDGTITVAQGALEGANVTAISQLTHLIELQRSVGITNSLINNIYTLQQRTSRILSQQTA